ncbi:MAG: DnaJ domain-containing protein [Alphaproteobacteria bacterium]|nr:DnaJ domain-containing protein [Alphaproteobacteria bacterium]
MADPYQILGVPKTATAHEIKGAYRKLAKKLHPDVNPGRKDIEQKFKEVTAAYDLLSDADKRARFDRGEIDAQGQERGFGGGYGGGFGNGRTYTRSGGFAHDAGADPFSSFGGMDDIFAEFMGAASRGGKRAHTGTMRGADVTYSITVPFAEACLGGKKRVTLTNDKTVDVTIPPGVEDGHKLRLKGQGLAGAGGGAGDAIVEIHIEPHAFFTRKERDIYAEVPVSLPEAVLGASVTVPTLDGQVAVKVPKGANTGTTLRLKGKGVGAAKGGTAGDMFVKLKVVLPDPVPQDLTDFIEKWAKKNAYDPRKKAGI